MSDALTNRQALIAKLKAVAETALYSADPRVPARDTAAAVGEYFEAEEAAAQAALAPETAPAA